MPPLPFDPPALSTIGERAYEQALGRARENIVALQEYARTGLSPLEEKLQLQRLAYYRSVETRTLDLIQEVREQRRRRAAEAQEDALRPSRRELHRSSRDRMAAILGNLERERRRNAPLSRAATERAQATAASRRMISKNVGKFDFGVRALRKSQFAQGGLFGASQFGSFIDPCVEVDQKQSVRRQIMFAQQSAGRGYKTPHHQRRC